MRSRSPFSPKSSPRVAHQQFHGAAEALERRELFSVSPDWLATVGGTALDLFAYVAAHDAGGFSATGRFGDTIDVDPGEGVTSLTSTGYADMVVARYSDSGALLWAKQLDGSFTAGRQFDSGVAVDRAGNTYALGIFDSVVRIDGQTLTGDASDGVVAKFDPAGNLVWMKAIRTSSSIVSPRDVQGIAIDDSDANPNNWGVFVSGFFNGTATLGNQTLRSTSKSADGFVARMSATTGDVSWANVVGGRGSQRPVALAVAAPGDSGLYISGGYETELTLGGTTLVGGNNFLAKVSTSTGATIWAKSVAASGDFGALDATSSGPVVAGNFSGTVDFDPGPSTTVLTSAGGEDTAILKLDPNGNFAWARRMGGSGGEYTQRLAATDAGAVYVSGSFVGTADFGSQMLVSEGAGDGFLVELASDGAFIQTFAVPDAVHGIDVALDGAVFVAAAFNGSAIDSFPTGDRVVSSGNSDDVALLKFSPQADPISPVLSIDTFTAARQSVFSGESSALSVTRVHDPSAQITTIAFYHDNGDGVLDPATDSFVGTDSNSAGGWSATASTTGLSGTQKFFAAASDSQGQLLAQSSLILNVIDVETIQFHSANVPRAIPDRSTITSTLVVPSGSTILDLDVTLSISHTFDADLDVFLTAPNGTRVPLFQDVGSSNDNFFGTVLNDEAAIDISAGTAPFSGSFRPQGLLSAFDGLDAGGSWTLEITDDERKDSGTLNSWSLLVTRPAPAPLQSAGGPVISGGKVAKAVNLALRTRDSQSFVDRQAAVDRAILEPKPDVISTSTAKASATLSPISMRLSAVDQVFQSLIADELATIKRIRRSR